MINVHRKCNESIYKRDHRTHGMGRLKRDLGTLVIRLQTAGNWINPDYNYSFTIVRNLQIP